MLSGDGSGEWSKADMAVCGKVIRGRRGYGYCGPSRSRMGTRVVTSARSSLASAGAKEPQEESQMNESVAKVKTREGDGKAVSCNRPV